MNHLDKETARRILDALSLALDGKPASAKTFSDVPFTETPGLSWWENYDVPKDTPRTRALVLAYAVMSGGTIPLSGVKLADSFFRPDKYIVGALLKAGRATMNKEAVVLTETGWLWIAEMLEAMAAGATRD